MPKTDKHSGIHMMITGLVAACLMDAYDRIDKIKERTQKLEGQLSAQVTEFEQYKSRTTQSELYPINPVTDSPTNSTSRIAYTNDLENAAMQVKAE